MQGCKPGSRGQATPRPVHTSFDEAHFFVLLFPKHEILTDTTGKVHSIDRAAIASIPELKQKHFTMHVGKSEPAFNRDHFTPLANEDKRVQYIVHLNGALKEWGESTDWRSASLKMHELVNEPGVGARLTLVYKSGRRAEFIYEIDDANNVNPIGIAVGTPLD